MAAEDEQTNSIFVDVLRCFTQTDPQQKKTGWREKLFSLRSGEGNRYSFTDSPSDALAELAGNNTLNGGAETY